MIIMEKNSKFIVLRKYSNSLINHIHHHQQNTTSVFVTDLLHIFHMASETDGQDPEFIA